MSEYQEFTGKSVEEALRAAREAFGSASLDDLDFEILTPGSRGVLGMGAEPARIIAAPRTALGGAAPRREAAAATPLPPRPRREEGDRERGRGGYDRAGGGPQAAARPAGDRASGERPSGGDRPSGDRRPMRDQQRSERPPAREDPSPVVGEDAPSSVVPASTGERPMTGRRDRAPRREERRDGRSTIALSQRDHDELASARASSHAERDEMDAAEASPEALSAGKEILERLLQLMGFQAAVTIHTGDTSKLDVTGDESDKEALGALIGRKGERLSALQHLVNLMLSRRVGSWTRILVDVEDYRGRRERQLKEIAQRAADHVVQSGAMLQLDPMPALERRWIHLALRSHAQVTTQSIGEEPQRRVVILRRD